MSLTLNIIFCVANSCLYICKVHNLCSNNLLWGTSTVCITFCKPLVADHAISTDRPGRCSWPQCKLTISSGSHWLTVESSDLKPSKFLFICIYICKVHNLFVPGGWLTKYQLEWCDQRDDGVVFYLHFSFWYFLEVGASIVKWTKQVLRYTKAVVFLVKGL